MKFGMMQVRENDILLRILEGTLSITEEMFVYYNKYFIRPYGVASTEQDQKNFKLKKLIKYSLILVKLGMDHYIT